MRHFRQAILRISHIYRARGKLQEFQKQKRIYDSLNELEKRAKQRKTLWKSKKKERK